MENESRPKSRFPSGVLTLLAVSILALLFALSLRTPVSPAEATAAIAAVDATYTGEANISYQLGEVEPRRLPLQTWILSAIARGQPDRVSVVAARIVSLSHRRPHRGVLDMLRTFRDEVIKPAEQQYAGLQGRVGLAGGSSSLAARGISPGSSGLGLLGPPLETATMAGRRTRSSIT